jgi:hypothetical protein
MELLGEGEDWFFIHYSSELFVHMILKGAGSSEIFSQPT